MSNPAPGPPSPSAGGRSRYCDLDEHNLTTAFRARRSGRTAATGGGDAGERPTSLAGVQLRETVTRLAGLLEEFRQLAGSAAELLVLATDPDAVSAELAASRSEALRLVAEAEGRWAAEQRAVAAEDTRARAERARQVAEHRAGEAEARREREVGEARTSEIQARELAEQRAARAEQRGNQSSGR